MQPTFHPTVEPITFEPTMYPSETPSAQTFVESPTMNSAVSSTTSLSEGTSNSGGFTIEPGVQYMLAGGLLFITTLLIVIIAICCFRQSKQKNETNKTVEILTVSHAESVDLKSTGLCTEGVDPVASTNNKWSNDTIPNIELNKMKTTDSEMMFVDTDEFEGQTHGNIATSPGHDA